MGASKTRGECEILFKDRECLFRGFVQSGVATPCFTRDSFRRRHVDVCSRKISGKGFNEFETA